MKTRNVILVCLAMLTMGSVQTQAQGLGGLLKKAKKILDTAKEQTTTTSSTAKSQSGTVAKATSDSQGETVQAIPLQGGGSLYNPFENKLDIEVVGLYGTSKTMNFGNVSVVLKLKAKTVIDRINYIGDKDKSVAYDDEGNVYRINQSASGIKVAEGISVKADLGTYGLYFVNVPKKTQKLQLVKLYLYNDFEDGNGAKAGYIELRNVPVTWQK